MPYPYRTCSRQLHHSQTHGPQSHPKGPRKGLSPLKAQSRRLGRQLPCEPHRRMIPSPDSPGSAVLVFDDDFTVDHSREAAEAGASLDDGTISARPVIAVASERSDPSVIDMDQGAESVVLDLVQPIAARRGFSGEGGKLGEQ